MMGNCGVDPSEDGVVGDVFWDGAVGPNDDLPVEARVFGLEDRRGFGNVLGHFEVVL